MQRYFIPAGQLTDTEATITGEDAHHLIKVMRARAGETIICSDGEGREVLAEILTTDSGTVRAKVIEHLPLHAEPAVQVWIAQSLPKGDKLETVIQKGTEIGASRFIPFLSARTIVQYDERKEAKRVDRWRKIAKEAAEQAHRNKVPQIDSPLAWKKLLQAANEADAAFFCYEKPSGSQLRTAIREALEQAPRDKLKLMLIIGPEGGFTEQELQEAEAAGCRAVSLGARILRTETAGMVGLTCILYESGEMGG
ncbi:16S rRNA (uracil(1498)-N(3))-methyltransferase [Paenibacillus koleovorans]|uniref:16S rRNA (uracil(1498)-N(3))-methyltransferase n=1 Tax=Paenibacillus koleovorans TaxID=121608 RepID=UPI000FD96654|nr:16S rRNA (uracil(1498)-N(3))-methyltransferase [Paenibacillus koleovorans]